MSEEKKKKKTEGEREREEVERGKRFTSSRDPFTTNKKE